MFMSSYRRPDWPDGAGAYGAFYFAGDGEQPLLQAGAFVTRWQEVLTEYDYSDTVDDLDDVHLAKYQGSDLAIKGAGDSSEWLYDERPWNAGEPDADITWAIQRLQAAASVFD